MYKIYHFFKKNKDNVQGNKNYEILNLNFAHPL